MKVNGQLHVSAASSPPPGKGHPTYWIQDWVSPRTGLDAAEKKETSALM
jgi:hypothetical protein